MAAPAYITTPIYYVNDSPHIGHLYTTTICDVYARFQRLAGRDVFFLTGTDEHGVKVEKSAIERGVSPKAHADENAAKFRTAFEAFGLSNDDFIRTTDEYHESQVQAFVERLKTTKVSDDGDDDGNAVYLGEFVGWYDEGQEEYYTETKAKELGFTSPISGRPLTRATQKNYFFRLSAFQDMLEKLFEEHPDFVRPEARRNEVLGRLREGLQDVPMTRTNFSWGIPMPGDPEHVIYVWIDALMNYITALGLGDPDSERYAARSKYWPPAIQVIGKEILWFHAVIWPAMLTALELPLPKAIYAHSFWISEGKKMSKSLGNFIDLPTAQLYVDTYGLDTWRYYLATQGPLGATDADFVAAKFHEVYTTDLVNTVGNCTSRVTAMICKYFDGAIPEAARDGSRVIDGYDWNTIVGDLLTNARQSMDAFDLAGAIGAGVSVIRHVDGFINATEPFKLAKDEARREDLQAILYQCAEALRVASVLLSCVLPDKMAEFRAAIGEGAIEDELDEACAWGQLEPGRPVVKVALFPRVDAPMETATA